MTTPSLQNPSLKSQYNAILQDKFFKEMFQSYPIKVVAPASGADPQHLATLQALTELKIEIAPNLLSKDIIFHSNNDEIRFALLKAALYDKSKNTILWTLKGGYGSARLINRLRFLPKPKQEKTFIGFSDNTALHLFLAQHWEWKTIHGSGLLQLLNPEADPQNFQKIAEIIAKKTSKLQITHLMAFNAQANHPKKISGPLIGGNLATIQSGIKTAWQMKAAGKIVFLEDTGEKGYSIDRMLYQLREAGLFKGVKGVVFGNFTDAPLDDIMIALERFAKEVQIPVYKTDQFGHGSINYPLVYNAASEIVPKGPNEFALIMHLN